MTLPILLLNCGSSSIKYQVIDADDESVLATGLIQRIGLEQGTIEHKVHGDEYHDEQEYSNHTDALHAMVEMFEQYGPHLSEVRAVGHRTVHGGDEMTHSTAIDEEVIRILERLSPLAPLHNPPGIAGIRAARRTLPDVPHVAVFDTAFHSTLPPEAYTYAIPTELAEKYSIRKYGFHGTSHHYVSRKAAELLGRPYEDVKQIVCHLGNGASITAIDGGRSVDTSMGLTPLQGLVMGTRSGDVDPGLIAYLHREAGLSTDAIDEILNKKSGFLGLCGVSDFRDLRAKIDAGDQAAALALEVYVHRLLHYIGGYMAILGGVDAIVFTAGLGENGDLLRAMVGDRLHNLGVHLDPLRNTVRSKEPRIISTDDSPIALLVVPTNEELQMAREVKEAIGA